MRNRAARHTDAQPGRTGDPWVVDTADRLRSERSAILAHAQTTAGLGPRYADPAQRALRLELLLDRVVAAVERRELSTLVDYARELARARFEGGFDIAEVQAAINALEEVVWRELAEPADIAAVATALGAAKDALAAEYVRLAAGTRSLPVDVDALFSGT